MQFTVPVEDGDPIEFECEDTFVSRWVCHQILLGKTYPALPFVDDVQVIFDIGANCGATTVFLARQHPGAQVHSFEPGSGPRRYLERNVARMANVHVHPIGLAAVDREAPLYFGITDSITASAHPREETNGDGSEMVSLRAAGPWVAEQGIDRIDILKVDVEGCEVEVLTSLEPLLPSVKVLYLEYDSRVARRSLARIVERTHELYCGVLFLDQGECIYLRKDIADQPAATRRLVELFHESSAETAGTA
jgi:FkbM family methyltransferase